MIQGEAKAVVVGASAGAIEALASILPALPEEFRLPVIIVVHIPPDKPSILADIFGAKCRIPVREAEDKEPIVPGTVYFAPPDYHLLVEDQGHLSLSSDEPVLFSRPSIDVLFESAADAYGSALIAIVLSGANQDGAIGMQAVVRVGGIALIQDPEGALAPTMPQAAIERCPDARVMSLGAIVSYLREM